MKLEPGGSKPITGAQVAQMAAKARCIRQHGFPNFTDRTVAARGFGLSSPSSQLESGSPSVDQSKEGMPHVWIAIPGHMP